MSEQGIKIGDMFWSVGADKSIFDQVLKQVDSAASTTSKGVESSLERMGASIDKTGDTGKRSFGMLGGVMGKLKDSFSNLAGVGGNALSSVTSALSKLTPVAVGALGGLVTGLVGVGVASVKASADFDKASDVIIAGTGASGEKLKEMQDALLDLNGTSSGVGHSMEGIAAVLAEVNTRTGATGDALNTLSSDILKLSRVTGDDAVDATAKITRVMGDWGVSMEDSSALVNDIFAAGQNFGIGVDSLSSKLVQFGAPLRQMGFSLDESIAMLGKWEKEGVNTELVIGSLRIAAGKFADEQNNVTSTTVGGVKSLADSQRQLDGLRQKLQLAQMQQGEFNEKTKESTRLSKQMQIDKITSEIVALEQAMAKGEIRTVTSTKATKSLTESLQETFERIKNAKDGTEALSIGMEVFGARAGPDMTAAIREGRFELEDAIAAMQGMGGALDDAASRTLSLGDKWTMLKAQAIESLLPLGDMITPLVDSMLDWATNVLPQVVAWITSFGAQASVVFENVRTAAQPFVDTLINWIVDIWPKIVQWVTTFAENTRVAFETARVAAEPIIVTLQNVFAQIMGIVELIRGGAGIEDVGASLGLSPETLGKITDTIESVREGWAKLVEFFEPTIERIKESLGPMIASFEPLVPQLQAWGAAALRLWDALKPLVEIIGGALVAAAKLLLDILAAVMPHAGTLIGNFVEIGATTLNTLAGVVTGLVDLVKALFAGDWQGAWNAASGIVGTVADGVVSIIGNMRENVVTIIQAMIEGVVNWFADLGIDIPAKMEGVKATVAAKFAEIGRVFNPATWASIGSNLIKSLADAISNKANSYLRKKAEGIASLLPKWVRDLLGIKSPSRVFYEIGLNIIDGMIRGIEGRTPEAIEAMAGVLNGIAAIFEGMAGMMNMPLMTNVVERVRAINEQLKTIVVVFTEFAAWSFNYGNVLPALADVASNVGSVVNALKSSIEAFVSLGDLKMVDDIAVKMRYVIENMRQTVVAIASFKSDSTLQEAASQAGALGSVAGAIASMAQAWSVVGKFESSDLDVDAVTQFLVDFASTATTKLNDAIAKLPDIVENLKEGAGAMTSALSVVSNAAQVWSKLSEITTPISNVDTLVDSLTQFSTYVAQSLSTAMTQTIPEGFSEWVKGVSEALGLIEDAAQTWQELTETEAIAQFDATVVTDWLDKASVMLEQVTSSMSNLYARIKDMAPDAVAAADWIGDIVKPLQALVDGMSALYNAEQGTLDGILAHTRPKLEQVFLFLSGLYADVKDVAEDAASGASAVAKVVAPLQALVDGMSALYNAEQGTLDGILAHTRPKLEQVFLFFRNLWADVKDDASDAQLAAESAGKIVAPIAAILDAMSALYNARKRDLGDILSTIRQQLILVFDMLDYVWWSVEGRAANAVEAAKASGEIADNLAKSIAFLSDLNVWRNVPDMEDRFHAFRLAWDYILDELSKVREDADAAAYDEARKYAVFVGQIAGYLRDAMEFLADVKDFSRVGVDAIDAFVADFATLLTKLFEGVSGEDIDALADEITGKAAENASKIASGLQSAMSILDNVREWVRVPQTALNDFTTDYQKLLLDFAKWIGDPNGEGYLLADDVVGKAAENAQKVASALSSAMDVLKRAVDYASATATLDTFKADYQKLFGDFATWATGAGSVLADDLVGAVATNAEKIASALSDSLTVLAGLVDYSGVSGALDSFKTDYQKLMLDFATWAQGEGAAVGEESVGKVAENVESISAGLLDALQALTGLGAYVRPTLDTINGFVADVAVLMREFKTQVADKFVPEAADAVKVWGEATGAAASGLLDGLELLSGLHFYSNVANERIDLFIADIAYLFGKVKTMASGVSQTTNESVSQFSKALGDMVSGLMSALGLFEKLAKLDEGTKDFISGVYTPGTTPTSKAAQTIGAVYNAINNTIATFKTKVLDVSGTSWIPASTLFFNAVDKLIGTLASALDLFVDLDKHGVPDVSKVQSLVNAVMSLFGAMGIDLQRIGNDTGAAAEDIVDEVWGIQGDLPTSAQTKSWSNLSTSGLVAGLTQYVTGVKGSETIEGKARYLTDLLYSIVKDNVPQKTFTTELGAAVGQGLVLGLDQQQASVAASATKLASSITKPMTFTLKIESPSKWAKGIAQNVGGTLANSLGDQAKVVSRAANVLANELVAPFAPLQSELAFVNANASASVTNKRMIEAHVTIDGDALSDAQMYEMADFLGRVISDRR